MINAVRSLALGDVPPPVRQQLFAGQSTASLVVQSMVWTAALALVFGYLAVRRYNSASS